MVWMDRVRSRAYQMPKTAARSTAKRVELIQSGTPRLSVRLSVSRVPTTLINTTASQYIDGTYRFSRNCPIKAMTRPAENSRVVLVSPKPRVSLM